MPETKTLRAGTKHHVVYGDGTCSDLRTLEQDEPVVVVERAATYTIYRDINDYELMVSLADEVH